MQRHLRIPSCMGDCKGKKSRNLRNIAKNCGTTSGFEPLNRFKANSFQIRYDVGVLVSQEEVICHKIIGHPAAGFL